MSTSEVHEGMPPILPLFQMQILRTRRIYWHGLQCSSCLSAQVPVKLPYAASIWITYKHRVRKKKGGKWNDTNILCAHNQLTFIAYVYFQLGTVSFSSQFQTYIHFKLQIKTDQGSNFHLKYQSYNKFQI